MKQRYLFIGAFILAASGLVSPPVALAIGLAYGVAFYSSDHPGGKNLSKILLQASVVGLGFGMNLHEVVHAGRSGFLYTAFGITGSMIVGLGLGRLMKVGDTSSLLITVGDSDLWRERHCRRRPDREGYPKKRWQFRWQRSSSSIPSRYCFPHDRLGDASHPNPIRLMVGSRDS